MAKKLYVGSLPYSVNETQLRELFEPFGGLESVRLILDKFTGKSKGFGFVEFESDESADKAIQEMHGKEIDGRALVVNEARPEAPRERGGFGGGGGRGGFGGRGGRGGGGGSRGGRDQRREGGGGGRNRW